MAATMRWMSAVVLILAVGACNQSAPMAPALPHTIVSQNQAPRVSAGPLSPALGIDEVTTFTFRVEVSDPDGDPVSLKILGCPHGQEVPVSLENGAATVSFKATRTCLSTITLMATDRWGATSAVNVPFAHTSFRSWYRLVVGEGFYDQPFFFVNLEQSGTAITGTIRDLHGHEGSIEPQEPGVIDAAGRFRIRFRIQSEGDLVVAGQVISAESSLFSDVVVGSGSVTDGLHAGRAFKLWREAQY